MDVFALIALGITLGYACLQRAAVEPADWNPCLLAIGVIGALYFLAMKRGRAVKLSKVVAISGCATLAVAALQLVPLPAALVRVLSPARWEALHSTEAVAGPMPRWVPLSIEPHVSAQWLLTLAGLFLVFLIARESSARLRSRPWAAVWPLLIVVGLEAALGFYQSYAGGGESTGTYNNRDHYAGLLEMTLPFAAMYALAILQRGRKPHEWPVGQAIRGSAMLALAALLLVSVVFSLSRMGFFCALAGLFVCAALRLFVRSWRVGEAARAPLWRRLMPVGLAVVVTLIGFVFLPTDPLIARFSDFASGDDITADTRAQLWRNTAPLIADYPLFGCGAGTYESCFLKYKTVAPMHTADFAHNDYLQVLAEFGIFGFAAGCVFVFRILAGAGRAVLYAQTIDGRFRAIACVASFTAILLHSFVDFNMYIQANAMLFAWIAGIAASDLTARPQEDPAEADALPASALPGYAT